MVLRRGGTGPSLPSRGGEGIGFVVQSRVKSERQSNQTHKQPKKQGLGVWRMQELMILGE